jgi:hypothetical protein
VFLLTVAAGTANYFGWESAAMEEESVGNIFLLGYMPFAVVLVALGYGVRHWLLAERH